MGQNLDIAAQGSYTGSAQRGLQRVAGLCYGGFAFHHQSVATHLRVNAVDGEPPLWDQSLTDPGDERLRFILRRQGRLGERCSSADNDQR